MDIKVLEMVKQPVCHVSLAKVVCGSMPQALCSNTISGTALIDFMLRRFFILHLETYAM